MQKFRTFIIWVCLIGLFLFIYSVIHSEDPLASMPLKDFQSLQRCLAEETVAAVQFSPQGIVVTLNDGEQYRVAGTWDAELLKQLDEAGAAVTFGDSASTSASAQMLIGFLPFLIVLLLFVFFLRRMNGGQQNFLHMLKSRARNIPEGKKITFAEVGGLRPAKELLGDIVSFLRDAKQWKQIGARPPRGVLLQGPPGCGKTLLARAVAGETNAHFFYVSASEFVEMFVGVGAARVRDMFEKAAKQAPAVVFIDELDAVGRRRGSGIGTAHDEREQTLNQLLVCMDGVENNDQVVIIAATNRADILDKALLRPGRFDRCIDIGMPDEQERCEILRIHCSGKVIAGGVSIEEMAALTAGLHGAHLESLVNEAALRAVRRIRNSADGQMNITRDDLVDTLHDIRRHTRDFDKLDVVLIESATQLAQPTGHAVVRAVLTDGLTLHGEVVWADAKFIKLRETKNGRCLLVAKNHLQHLESAAGTEAAEPGEAVRDPWAALPPGCA